MGIITTIPTAVGEGSLERRAGNFLHGGGGTNPFEPNQGGLFPTFGCIRMYNQDVIALIGHIQAANAAGDILDLIFAGDKDYLLALAKQKNSRGEYLYPPLREMFCADLGICGSQGAAGPELKFQDIDPYAVYESPLDDEEDENDGNSFEDDYDEPEIELDEPEVEHPHDYG